MTMSKKITAALLAALLLLTMAGCANDADPHAGHDHGTTADPHAGHDHGTTADPHAGHSHNTTTGAEADDATSELNFDEVVTLTMESKIPAGSRVFRDTTAGEPNYTLKLTAGTDLTQMQLISLDSESGKPNGQVRSFPALKKGESQYILTYINDANANRGIACTDSTGKTWVYAFLYSGNSGRVYLGFDKASH